METHVPKDLEFVASVIINKFKFLKDKIMIMNKKFSFYGMRIHIQ